MKRVYVNENWCLGCRLCEYHCAFAESRQKDMARALRGVKINPAIRIEANNGISFAVSCRHCKQPLCVKACITGALHITNGIITADKARCVGCYTCILSCPFGAISQNETGVIQKCELCTASHGSPACVKGCPNNALVYEERE
ncbi:MAG: 4Fe-4S binding protein [Firmicutes bacterium]|nr:4Fe-4S binding protein [Bacillota bacterium]